MAIPNKKKSLHELRAIAQAFGVNDIFEKDAVLLQQEIDLKQQAMIPTRQQLPDAPQYDARLMTMAPAEMASPNAIVDLLKDHIKLGLRIELSEEHWSMGYGLKTDDGTMRMPLKTILLCANKLMS